MQSRPLIPRGWLRAIIFFLISFLFNGFMFEFTDWLASEILHVSTDVPWIMAADSERLPVMLAMTAIQVAGTLLLVWLFRRYVDRQSMKSLGFSVSGRWKDIAIGFLLGLVLMGGGFLILMALGNLEVHSLQVMPYFLIQHFLLFLLVSVQEEAVSRGYILNNLMESMGKYQALFLSAAIFAVFHLMNPNLSVLGFVNILLGGLLMGVYYIHRKNLWFPIAVHLSWNFFQGPVLGFGISGKKLEGAEMITQDLIGPEWLTGGAFGFEGSLIACVLVLVAVYFVDRFYGTRRH